LLSQNFAAYFVVPIVVVLVIVAVIAVVVAFIVLTTNGTKFLALHNKLADVVADDALKIAVNLVARGMRQAVCGKGVGGVEIKGAQL